MKHRDAMQDLTRKLEANMRQLSKERLKRLNKYVKRIGECYDSMLLEGCSKQLLSLWNPCFDCRVSTYMYVLFSFCIQDSTARWTAQRPGLCGRNRLVDVSFFICVLPYLAAKSDPSTVFMRSAQHLCPRSSRAHSVGVGELSHNP